MNIDPEKERERGGERDKERELESKREKVSRSSVKGYGVCVCVCFPLLSCYVSPQSCNRLMMMSPYLKILRLRVLSRAIPDC